MNGAHDMGGVHGFGPVLPEANEPTFHAEWERRVFALVLAAGRPGQWNLDMMRFARENRPPTDYLAKSYYEIWLAGLEAMLAERGLVSVDEIEVGRPLSEPKKVDGILQHSSVEAIFSRGRPTERPASSPARFRIGDRVRAQGENPQWLYTVRFDARDLWGPEADQMLKVSVDAWEPYLEPADRDP